MRNEEKHEERVTMERGTKKGKENKDGETEESEKEHGITITHAAQLRP